MENKKQLKERIWLIAVLLIFSLPIIQEFTGLIKMDEVKGKVARIDKAELSIDSWFSGEFQEKTETYVQKKFDFRNFLIRLNSQFYCSFFGISGHKNIIISEDNYLFNLDILQSYWGEDLREEETIRTELEKLKFVQDTLEKLNKHLVFVIAPSKPYACSDKIPEEYQKPKRKTNYDVFVKQLGLLGINHIDYNPYFLKAQSESPYLLFPPKGLHWSIYSTTLVIDSLVNYIEQKKATQLSDYSWSDITLEDAKDNDKDVENVLNLFWPLKSPKLAYRKLLMDKRVNDSLKIVSVGDSFYAELFYNGLKDVLPSNNEFWFYGRIVKDHHQDVKRDVHFNQIDLRKKLDETDVFIVLYNDANLKSIGFKMFDRLYRLYTNQSLTLPYDEEYAIHVKDRMEEYRNNKSKMEELQSRAEQLQISLDSMLYAEASLMVELDVWNRRIVIEQ